ncbi:MAG: hypothetical protein AB1512_06830 [Thermodesulfobacteriota bacterium]
MRVEKIFREEVTASENGQDSSMEKIRRLTDVLRGLRDSRFTGYIKVNYSQGSIARVEKFEEILKK